jgi:ketosteroid isomerase-like protein
MESANAAAVLRAFDALNRRDLDDAFALVHPEAEFDWMESNAPYAEEVSGRHPARGRLEEFFGMWETLRWTPEELTEPDDSHVVAVTRIVARGRDGIELDAVGAWLWRFGEDGRAVFVKLCQTREDALAAIETGRG